MFKWYQNAQLCYVFLPDVYDISSGCCEDHGAADMLAANQLLGPRVCMTQFERSVWFDRGWTLQELIAPEHVEFYTARFRRIGSKKDLGSQISDITGIEQAFLNNPRGIERASVADRMSWASLRETTREEDIAYSLMGLFDVNMRTYIAH